MDRLEVLVRTSNEALQDVKYPKTVEVRMTYDTDIQWPYILEDFLDSLGKIGYIIGEDKKKAIMEVCGEGYCRY